MEIVKHGYIKAETQTILDKNVIDTEAYIQGANESWKSERKI